MGAALWLGGGCGGQSTGDGGNGGAPGPDSGARAGRSASGGTRPSSAGGTSTAGAGFGDGGVGANGDGGSGEAGAPTGDGAGGSGATTATAGSSPGGTSAGDGNPAAGSVGAAGETAAEGGSAGAGGPLECDDCSVLDATCFVGVCDTELGRCSRWPILACRSGDGCCPSLCARDNDDDCSSERVVLAPAYSGNRREDGALGTATFTGVQDGLRFHAFFAFDLSAVEGTITSAQLDLHYFAYLSPDPDEHFVVRYVTTDVEDLIDTALRPDVFDELQSGTYYLDTGMTFEHVGSLVAFELSTVELNASRGSFASFGIVADWALGDRSAVEGIVFSDGVEEPRERLTLVVEP